MVRPRDPTTLPELNKGQGTLCPLPMRLILPSDGVTCSRLAAPAGKPQRQNVAGLILGRASATYNYRLWLALWIWKSTPEALSLFLVIV